MLPIERSPAQVVIVTNPGDHQPSMIGRTSAMVAASATSPGAEAATARQALRTQLPRSRPAPSRPVPTVAIGMVGCVVGSVTGLYGTARLLSAPEHKFAEAGFIAATVGAMVTITGLATVVGSLACGRSSRQTEAPSSAPLVEVVVVLPDAVGASSTPAITNASGAHAANPRQDA